MRMDRSMAPQGDARCCCETPQIETNPNQFTLTAHVSQPGKSYALSQSHQMQRHWGPSQALTLLRISKHMPTSILHSCTEMSRPGHLGGYSHSCSIVAACPDTAWSRNCSCQKFCSLAVTSLGNSLGNAVKQYETMPHQHMKNTGWQHRVSSSSTSFTTVCNSQHHDGHRSR